MSTQGGRSRMSLGCAPTARRGRPNDKKRLVECCGIPLKPKYGLTPISCHAVLERSACAPFIKERRTKCINATSLRRKSGQMEHSAFVAGQASWSGSDGD